MRESLFKRIVMLAYQITTKHVMYKVSAEKLSEKPWSLYLIFFVRCFLGILKFKSSERVFLVTNTIFHRYLINFSCHRSFEVLKLKFWWGAFSPFLVNVPILYPLKIRENQRLTPKVFWCFHGDIKWEHWTEMG